MTPHPHKPSFWGFIHPDKRLDAGKLICTFRCRGCPLKLRLEDSQSRLYDTVKSAPAVLLFLFVLADRLWLQALPQGWPALLLLGGAYLVLYVLSFAVGYALARYVPAPEEEQDKALYREEGR